MKKSDRFAQWQRQSVGVIAVAIVKYMEGILRQVIWPLIILYIFGRGTDTFTKAVIYISLFTGVFSIVASVFRYTHFYFRVQGGKLSVRQGVVTTRNVSVPIEKIQRVEFEQNVVHRALGLVTLRVETAGAEEEEVEIGALKRGDAEALRACLLVERMDREEDITQEEGGRSEGRMVFHLGVWDLIKAGLLSNHLQTFGVVFGFLIGMYFQFEDILDLDVLWKKWFPRWYYQNSDLVFLLFAVPVALISVILLTLVRVFVRYFGFRMWRREGGYQVSYGLLNRRTYSSLDKKVQYLYWRDNMLMRVLGIYNLNIFQAGSVALRSSQSIVVPFCYQVQIDRVKSEIFGRDQEKSGRKFVPERAYFGLLLSRYGLLPAAFLALTSLHTGALMASLLGVGIWLVVVMIWSWFYLQSMGMEVGREYISIKKGVFRKKKWFFQYNKLQGITLRSNPVEGWRGLRTLQMHTAAGDLGFPYLSEGSALEIANLLLYRIERDRVSWM